MAATAPSRPAGVLVIIAGPSGSGKTTLVRRLMARHPEYRLSVSATTRARRPGEKHGQDYFFETPDAFARMIAAGELLEWSEHFGNRYGTPRAPVERDLARGCVVVLEIDVIGARQVKDLHPDAYVIFISAPGEAALRKRLRGRGTETEEHVRERLERARMETNMARNGLCDAEVVNDDLDRAVAELEELIAAKARKKDAR